MNELCHYICTWEKKHILWNNKSEHFDEIRNLILNQKLDLSDKKAIRIIRRTINEYANELRAHMNSQREASQNELYSFSMEEIINRFRERLSDSLSMEEEIIANYVIKVSYQNLSISKSLAWTGYGDYIIRNLKANSDLQKNIFIQEVPHKTEDSYEYLGKFFTLTEVDVH